MTTQRCLLPACDRPTDTNACRTHVERVTAALRTVRLLAVELETTRCRLDALAPTGTGKGAEAPMVWKERAAEAEFVLRNTLTTWARDLWETYGPQVPTCSLCGVPNYLHAEGPAPQARDWPLLLDLLQLRDGLGEVAEWIARRPTWIANHPEAAELVGEIQSAIGNAWAAVDRPSNRTSFEVGPCPEQTDETDCDGTVWAYIPTEDDRPAMLRCSDCDGEWNTTQWLRIGRRILRAMGREVA